MIITRSRALDLVRAEKSRARTRDGYCTALGSSGADRVDLGPMESAANREKLEVLRDALSRLSEKQRVAVQMAFLDGLTHDQIAEELKTPLGTVKFRIRDALKKLSRDPILREFA